jgi:hypothetical protein
LDAPASGVAGGGCLIGSARLKKHNFLIKYFLNSNSAGANCNLATTVACAVYSAVSGDAIIRVITAQARKPVTATIMMIFDAVRLENNQASGNF